MKNNDIIVKMIDYIEDNLENNLKLDDISKKAGYSKFHLNRMFSDYVGCTIYKYAQQRRLTLAAEKLVYTDKPITDIAYETGYNSQQAFTLAFRQLYGCPPWEYRVLNIYTPKFNRFSSNSRNVMSHQYTIMGVAA